MKGFCVITDLNDLSFVALNKLSFAIPLKGPNADSFMKAIDNLGRDGYGYNGGAFIDISGSQFQIFYPL